MLHALPRSCYKLRSHDVAETQNYACTKCRHVSQHCLSACCILSAGLWPLSHIGRAEIDIDDILSQVAVGQLVFGIRFMCAYVEGSVGYLPVPVAAWSKAWVCGRSLDGIAGSNPARGMDVCLLWVLCVVRQRSLRRAYLSSRRILPTVQCLSMISKHPQRRPLGLSSHAKFYLHLHSYDILVQRHPKIELYPRVCRPMGRSAPNNTYSLNKANMSRDILFM